MPFCPQCGVDNPDSARFCDQCGAALVSVAANAPASVATSAPAASTMPPVQPVPVAANQPLVVGPTVCAQCGATAIPGEAFCDNCGAPLNAPARPAASVPVPPYSPGLPPQPVYPSPQPAMTGSAPVASVANTPPAASTLHAPPSYTSGPAAAPSYTGSVPPPYAGNVPTPPPAPVTPLRTSLAPARMVAVASGAVLQLPNVTQAVIGRNDPVSKFFPDIDLTPYGALEGGVGRRHARLFIHEGQLMVEDMDSTNGTLLNGQKLASRQPQLVRDGDHLQFGKLLLRIQF